MFEGIPQIGCPPPSPAPTLGDLLEPMPGKIAVQVETKDEITPAGLYIPVETAKTIHESRATQGKVVAVGWGDDSDSDDDSDLEEAPHRVKLGDVVVFGKYTGTKLEWRPAPGVRETVLVMFERDVLAILHSPEQVHNLKVRA